FEIERGVYRLGHLAKRAQLLDGARELARARLDLIEQPHVLNRDHRLIGKGGHQLDFFLGERPYRSAQKRDYADGSPLSQKRDSEHRPEPRKLDRFAPGIFWISEYIRNMDHLAFESGSSCKRSSPKRYRILSLVFQEFLRGAMISGEMKEIADSL